jgi:hypothetical protein
MNEPPEVRVLKRKPLSAAKAAKRLKKFLQEQQGRDHDLKADSGGEDNYNNAEELVCKVPEDTLFQLQQIHDAITGVVPQDLSQLISAFDAPAEPATAAVASPASLPQVQTQLLLMQHCPPLCISSDAPVQSAAATAPSACQPEA